MEIVISIGAKVAEYTFGSIIHQLGYLFHYKTNITGLKEQRQDLESVKNQVKLRIDEENDKLHEIKSDVVTWLKNVDEIEKIIESNKISDISCFSLVKRYQQSRKAKKIVEEISQIIEKRKMLGDIIGHPIPLSGIGSSALPQNYQILETRTLKAKEIKDALANPNVNKVGIHGMGGVGKTMLLNEIEKLVMEDKLFDQVIKVTIGQSIDIERIQARIGDEFRLELKQRADSTEGRAAFIRNKLKTENNILIMLDDLWDGFDLENVGILCRSNSNSKGCKIIITSRKSLTNYMNTDMDFQVDVLSPEESLKFFMTIIGKVDDIGTMLAKESIEVKVANKCGRLPITLTTVAKALKGKDYPIWKDALKQLENPQNVNIEGMSDLVYSSIKLSYDYTKSTEVKSLFLLCSIFPDDYEISMEALQLYAMGMGLLTEVETWDESKNRVIKLIDDLICSSLLLKSKRYQHVQMHDVIRDTAINIASSNEGNMRTLRFGYKHGEWPKKDRHGPFRAIFGNNINFDYLPQDLKFQNLELLILNRTWNVPSKLEISNTFFEGMEKLKVLELSRIDFVERKISITHALIENLQVLCLRQCSQLKDLDAIGELKKLQVLRIQSCVNITQLPTSMSKLKELRVMEVSYCFNLKVIPDNVLSNMTQLEELDLSRNFEGLCEIKYEELKFLPHLINLNLDVWDGRMVSKLLFLENLELQSFCLTIGSRNVNHLELREYSIALFLKIESEVGLIDQVFGKLWQKCENLCIDIQSGTSLNFRFKSNENGVPHLIEENPENPIPFFDDKVAFPELKQLIIDGNDSDMIWKNDGNLVANSFSKLQRITFRKFCGISYIFSSNVAMELVSLNKLYIEECELVESIFEMEEPKCKPKENARPNMPLEYIELHELQKLKCVWNKDPTSFLTFPNLRQIVIRDCPQLQNVFPSITFLDNVKELKLLHIANESRGMPVQLVSEDSISESDILEIVFPSLTFLKVGLMTNSVLSIFDAWFPRLTYLTLEYQDLIAFPWKIFLNIECLQLNYVSKLVQVFLNEEDQSDHTSHQGQCANLKSLVLKHIPELTHVWTENNNNTSMFDNLEEIIIEDCNELKYLAPPSITFLNLRTLRVGKCDKLMNLLSSSSMAKRLVELNVYRCGEMSCIYPGKEDEEEDHKVVFSRLESLDIYKMPKMESFYSGKCELVFPSLKNLEASECPKMKMFSYGAVSTPKLEVLKMNGVNVLSDHTLKYDINDIFSKTFAEGQRQLCTQDQIGEDF